METKTKNKPVKKNARPTHISGAEAVIRCLLAEGVDLIYGYPGGAIMPVYDELYKFQDQLQHVLTRHEQGATHAAQGYARTSGKVGVAVATSGCATGASTFASAFSMLCDSLSTFGILLIADNLAECFSFS